MFDVINNTRMVYFYRVRVEAATELAKYAGVDSTWRVLDKLMLYYKTRFYGNGMTLPAAHDFSDLQDYFVKKAVAASMGSVKGTDGFTPAAVLSFLLDLLKNNDNSINMVRESMQHLCSISLNSLTD